jgi:hypothetical protein
MADHLQQQILESVQATIATAATAAGSNVFLDRVDEVPQANLPAVHIEGGDEEALADSLGFPAVYNRTYSFSVACVCGQATGAAKAARNLAKQTEAAMLATVATFTAGGKAQALVLTGSSETKDGSGAVSLFEVRQQWQARYITLGGTPDLIPT